MDEEECGTLTFEELLDAARRGNWDEVDANINPHHVTPERLRWALKVGLTTYEDSVRELSALLFFRSNAPLGPDDIELLEGCMVNDRYHLVAYRLAIALYKKSVTSELVLLRNWGQSPFI